MEQWCLSFQLNYKIVFSWSTKLSAVSLWYARWFNLSFKCLDGQEKSWSWLIMQYFALSNTKANYSLCYHLMEYQLLKLCANSGFIRTTVSWLEGRGILTIVVSLGKLRGCRRKEFSADHLKLLWHFHCCFGGEMSPALQLLVMTMVCCQKYAGTQERRKICTLTAYTSSKSEQNFMGQNENSYVAHGDFLYWISKVYCKPLRCRHFCLKSFQDPLWWK